MISQDPYFGNIDSETLYFNPANVSYAFDNEVRGKVAIKYRDQWNNISSPAFRTMSMEGEFKIYGSHIDSWHIGLIALSDRSNTGLLKQNGINLQTAYSRKLFSGRKKFQAVTLGVDLGTTRTNSNTNELWFSRQYDQTKFEIDPNLSNGETSLLDNTSHYSLNLGAKWQYHHENNMDVIIGLAAHHLNNPPIGQITNTYNLSQRYLLFLMLEKNIRRNLRHKLGLSILNQSPSQQIIPSYGVSIDFPEADNVAMHATLSTRLSKNVKGYLNDAILISIGIKSKQWYGGFSYEINTSGLNFVTRGNGAMELSLGYYFLSEN